MAITSLCPVSAVGVIRDHSTVFYYMAKPLSQYGFGTIKPYGHQILRTVVRHT